MKLSISNIAWPAEQDHIMYTFLQDLGFGGLEIAPSRIFPVHPYENLKEAKNWSAYLKETFGLSISSMQSIWYGREESLFSTIEQRKTLLEYSKKAIDFAAAIGCKNLVFGNPKNRMRPDNKKEEEIYPFFFEIAEYAYSHGVIIAIEANPTIYGTNFINFTSSALDLVKKIDSKGFLLNLDLGTMIENEEKIALLQGNIEFINHVHISEPYLKPIIARDLHRELAALLKEVSYPNYISIEMAKTDITKVKNTLHYIKEVFN